METPLEIETTDILRTLANDHRQDLAEGDLSDRLWQYRRYQLRTIPIAAIDLRQFAIDEATVSEYAARIQAGETPPPIVWDTVNGSVIDGGHRANAYALAGYTAIPALCGDEATYEPLPANDEDDEDSCSHGL